MHDSQEAAHIVSMEVDKNVIIFLIGNIQPSTSKDTEALGREKGEEAEVDKIIILLIRFKNFINQVYFYIKFNRQALIMSFFYLRLDV